MGNYNGNNNTSQARGRKMDKRQSGEVKGKYTKDIIELIDDYESSIVVPAFHPSAYTYFNYWMMTDPRDELYRLGLDDDPEVKKLDLQLLKGLKKFGPPDYNLEEQAQKPLKLWWWHLDKIYDKTYPAELLPEHLREFYLSSVIFQKNMQHL
ncbi:MAG: hypothetical protein ABDI07_11525 [Candidatus Kryptonium sp.]